MKSHTKVLLFTRLDMCQSKTLDSKKIIVWILYTLLSIIDKINEESNENKYLMLVFTDISK